MKAQPPAVLICEKCDTYFMADADFYTACNCGPPLSCYHGDVSLAVYSTTCPNQECRAKVSDTEHLEVKNRRI